MRRVFLLTAALLAASCRSSAPAPDLILAGGRVFTSDAARPWAQAVAIRGERIVAVGNDAEVRALGSASTRVVELNGRLVIPGINDAHLHQPWRAWGEEIEIPDTATVDDVLAHVAEAVKRLPEGTPIVGSFPIAIIDDPRLTREALDAVAPGDPVVLGTLTGHARLHNSAAMKWRNITTPWLREYALWQKDREMTGSVSDATFIAAMRDFANAALRFGITSVQSMPAMHIDRAARLAAATGVPLRWRWMEMVMGEVDQSPHTAVKYILDGTPIERSAALRQPYADRPQASGAMDWSDDEIRTMVQAAATTRQPLLLHVAGDLPFTKIFPAMKATAGDWPALRVRVEHGDFISDFVDDAKRLGVVVVQNPSHFMLRDCTMARYGAERLRNFMPLRSLIARGIPVAIGSDGPINPYLNIMFATMHPTNPPEAITREQVVIAYTHGSAYAEFKEGEKGTIAPGKLADLAVLSQDIFTVSPPELPKTEAVLTIIGGKVVYERERRPLP